MLNYLKKFVLEILPSLAATIIGAYIVHHYIMPAAAPKDPAAVAQTAAKGDPKPDTATADKDSFARGVAEKTAIEKTAERAAEKAPESATDLRKKHGTSRSAIRGPSAEPPAVADPAAEDRRDANDLARAAIERLRPPAEPPRTVAVATTPPPSAMLPLSPAMTVSRPAPEVFNAGTGAVMTPEKMPQTQGAARMAARPTPPADIPTAPPLDLHTDEAERTTVAEDVMSAAKSVFHAVLPR